MLQRLFALIPSVLLVLGPLLMPVIVFAGSCEDGCEATMQSTISACARDLANNGGAQSPVAVGAYETCARNAQSTGASCKAACPATPGSAAAPAGSQGSASSITLLNPLGLTDPRAIIGRIIKGVLSVIGTLTLAMFVYGGILWITSMGDPGKVMQGKKIFIWTTLGLAIIAGAYVAVNAIMVALSTGSVTGSVTP